MWMIVTYFHEATHYQMARSQNWIYAFFIFFFIKQVDGLIEAKGGFSLMVIMYTCLAKVRVQGQHYTLVLYILWYQNPMQMDGWWYFILWYHGSGVQSQNFSDIMMWYKFLGREGGPWKKITFERGATENYFP